MQSSILYHYGKAALVNKATSLLNRDVNLLALINRFFHRVVTNEFSLPPRVLTVRGGGAYDELRRLSGTAGGRMGLGCSEDVSDDSEEECGGTRKAGRGRRRTEEEEEDRGAKKAGRGQRHAEEEDGGGEAKAGRGPRRRTPHVVYAEQRRDRKAERAEERKKDMVRQQHWKDVRKKGQAAIERGAALPPSWARSVRLVDANEDRIAGLIAHCRDLSLIHI